MNQHITIASFDLGKKNFAFCVEEIDLKQLDIIKNIPAKQRYNIDGTPTTQFNKILNDVYKSGRLILYQNSDITENCDPKAYIDPELFHNMVDLLDKYAYIWDTCDRFIIEQQMSFGKSRNPLAFKLGMHCYSYFIFRYGRFKKVVEWPAYHKTKILGASKKIVKKRNGKQSYIAVDKPTRKKWAVTKAIDILQLRNDNETIRQLAETKKKDDLADVLCQLQSYKYMILVDK